jgi:curved DNA-binding protein
LRWKGSNGLLHRARGRGLDVSTSGLGIDCPLEIKPGSLVHIEASDGSAKGEYAVVYCTSCGMRYRVGVEFREEAETETRGAEVSENESEFDYYDILQISPKADVQTIHRVFRIMAARFHPDNPETGDVEQFLRLKRAYTALSDVERRAAYDAQRESRETGPMPIFELKEFVTGVEAEANRRLGVLSLLYNQRRASPDHPGVSLLDLEQRMGFPREYLSFTMWYLRAKEFIIVADNSDFSLTAAGADYVEKKAARNDIVSKLLRPGSSRHRPAFNRANGGRQSEDRGTRPRLLPSADTATP